MRINLNDFEIDKILSALIDRALDNQIIYEAIKCESNFSKNILLNERFKCIKLANKINDYMKQNNKTAYTRLYDKVNLSGVELKNYLSWLEKQEA